MLARFLDAAALDPGFLQNFWSTYRYVLVDEGQDLSPAQAAVVRSLVSSSVDLFVVADDRQSINGFAGGSFANVVDLLGSEAAAQALQLPHNFRCATAVLEAAEKVASNLRDKPPAASASSTAPPGAVRVVEAGSPSDEAELVAQWVAGLLESGLDPAILTEGEDPSVTPEEIAVIARARWLLDPVVEELTRRGVEVSIQTDTQSFLRSPQGRIVIEGIALAAAPDNAPARRRLIDELRGLGLVAEEARDDLPGTLAEAGLSDLAAIGQFLQSLTAADFAERVALLRSDAERAGWIDDLDSIESQWMNYAVAVPHHRRDLSGFLRHLSRAQQTRPTDPGVRVLTIHKVKGLEFKAVCIVGAYNGVLPDYRADSHDLVDEERRAFYVAMTRASRELVIVYPEVTTDRYGRVHAEPSIFIAEAGLL